MVAAYSRYHHLAIIRYRILNQHHYFGTVVTTLTGLAPLFHLLLQI
jgi:hypothetical protein